MTVRKTQAGFKLPDTVLAEMRALKDKHGCGEHGMWIVGTAAVMALLALPDDEAEKLIREARSLGNETHVNQMVRSAIKAKESRSVTGTEARQPKGTVARNRSPG